MSLSMNVLPRMVMGAGEAVLLAGHMREITRTCRAVLIADAFWRESPVLEAMCANLEQAGVSTVVFSEFAGEPKAAHIREAVGMTRAHEAGLVIGLGGGSALDIAKIVSICAPSGKDPQHYALGANPLPVQALPKILAPTTAGTGSEANGTAIFSDDEGKKLWVAGAPLIGQLAVLDSDLTASLPPHLTAWCAMDAFVHAFEASTNRWTHPLAQHFSLRALTLIFGALRKLLQNLGDAQARAGLLLGSFYAGYAIGNCGTALAHNISHALASLAPVHHGLATALAFEATLERLVLAGAPEVAAAAAACGVDDPADLKAALGALMTAAGIERQLPESFKAFTDKDLLREMMAEGTTSMREAACPQVSDSELAGIAGRIMDMA